MSKWRFARGGQHQTAPAETEVGELVALATALPQDVFAHDAALTRAHLDVHRDIGRADFHVDVVAFANAELAVESPWVETSDTCMLQQRAGALEQRAARKRDAQTVHSISAANALRAASMVPRSSRPSCDQRAPDGLTVTSPSPPATRSHPHATPRLRRSRASPSASACEPCSQLTCSATGASCTPSRRTMLS